MTVGIACEMYVNALQSIMQPKTALLGCTLHDNISMSSLSGCANQCIIGKVYLRSILSRRLLKATEDRPLSSLQAVN
jgi:hypothetical protein